MNETVKKEEDDKKPSEALVRTRRTYGRGFFDGLRSAGVVNVEEHMNESKLRQLEAGQSSVARKVLHVVPLGEPWPGNRIAAELHRQGHRMEWNVVEGCLRTLRDSKLIREPIPGHFIRFPVKPVAIRPSEPAMAVPAPFPAATPATPSSPAPERSGDPLGRLAELARSLRALAADLEEVALDVEARSQRTQGDTAKLQQLKDLLRGISDDSDT